MHFLIIFGIVLLLSAENYYFEQNKVIGEFYQSTSGRSQTICLRECNVQRRCIGVLKITPFLCRLVKRNSNQSFQVISPQKYWRKDSVDLRVTSEGLFETGGWFQHDFSRDGMFAVNDEIIPTGLFRGMSVLVLDADSGETSFEAFDIFEDDGDADTAEQALLNFVALQPNGSIVMMAVYDSANPCNTNCQTAMSLLGGTGQAIGFRDSVALVGYKCAVKPSWVQEVRNIYDTNITDVLPATASATIILSELTCPV